MSLSCRYTIPVKGNLFLQKPPPFKVNDLYLKFITDEEILKSVIIEFPIKEASEKSKKQAINDSLSIYEPRANEIEEIVLQIAGGLSLFSSSDIDIKFGSRTINWVEDGKESNLVVNLHGGHATPKQGATITEPRFIHSVLVGCIIKKHEPWLTFYRRGMSDALSHNYIEAFYNLYFIIEYFYGNGEFREKSIVSEFLKSQELCDTINSVIKDKTFLAISSDKFIKKINKSSLKEIFRTIVRTRGRLHHANKKQPNNWHPDKQNNYKDETILLQLACLNISMKRYFNTSNSATIEKANKKAQRCLRGKSIIHVVTE